MSFGGGRVSRGYLKVVPWVKAEADVAHGAGVISEPPGTLRVNAWRATAIRDSRECSRSANALKPRTPRSALAWARASSVAASWKSDIAAAAGRPPTARAQRGAAAGAAGEPR